MKCITILMLICISPVTSANSSLIRAAGKAIKTEETVVRIADIERKTARTTTSTVAQVNRAKHAQQIAAAQSRATFEQQANRQAATRHTEFLRVTAQQAEANRQRFAIESYVEKQVEIAKRNLPTRPVTRMTTAFNNNANPGLIYQRRSAYDVYIGQTKSFQRYQARQTEHKRALNKSFSFKIVGSVAGGNKKLLRVAEQAAYDAQEKYARKLNLSMANAIRPMAKQKYLEATKLKNISARALQ